MVEIRRYPHLLVDLAPFRIPFAAHGGGATAEQPPPVQDRKQHYQRLSSSLESAIQAKIGAIAQLEQVSNDADLHVSVSARSDVGVLTGDSFQSSSSPLRLLSIKGEGRKQRANLLLSRQKAETLRQRASAYADWDGEKRRPNNFSFFESIDHFYPSRLEDLWLDDERLLPAGGKVVEWEIWVRSDAALRLRGSAKQFGVRFEGGEVEFSRVRVLRAYASRASLQQLIDASGAIMELRACSSLTLEILDLEPAASLRLKDTVVSRIKPPASNVARIAILDTGVDFSHPLLSPALPQSRCQALSDSWPSNGWDPHGTRVAGIALYPDLETVLSETGPIRLKNSLESIAVLRPPNGERFAYEAVGEVAAAVEKLESSEEARRVFCLAFTSPRGLDNGVPSTLSGSVDQLAWGKNGEPRLFCVAAGNILDEPLKTAGYASRNEESGITCPGQALNALTVGGCTFLEMHPDGGELLAGPGDISPTSRTSCSWSNNKAIKPDVVFEAGNHSVNPDEGSSLALPELGVLTTNKHPIRRFATLSQTSAATAAVAGMAGRLMTDYPAFWPETVRGLIVHSADWTPAMLDRVSGLPSPQQKERLVSMFGYGVPDEARAGRSASDALTLVAQSQFTPFSETDSGTVATELAYHDLPWPKDILRGLGTTIVELRITLSYFIEPDLSAAAAGRWSRYPSHRLGFDLRGPDDDELDVLRRQNKADLARRTAKPPKRSEKGWALGSQLRERGTIHHDRFNGPAVDLARQNGIRVTPKKGWWTDDVWEGAYVGIPIRYSLIVSLHSPEIRQDIYQATLTELASMAKSPSKVLTDLSIKPATTIGRK